MRSKNIIVKKFFSMAILIFSFAATISLLSVNVSADEISLKTKADNFLNEYCFPIENPVSITEHDEEVIYELDYLRSGEHSYITYKELANGSVSVFVDEGMLKNEVVFSDDGVFIDGILTEIYNKKAVRPLATYATSWSTSVPSGATSFSIDDGVYNSNYNFGKSINGLTSAVIRSGLAVGFGAVQAYVAVFTYVADKISEYAVNKHIGSTVVAYSGPIKRCDSKAPLQYFYRYDMTFLIEGGRVVSQSLYKTDTLC